TRSDSSTSSASSTRSRTSTPGGRTAARPGRRTSAGASTTRSRHRASPRVRGRSRSTSAGASPTMRRSSSTTTMRSSGLGPYLRPAPLAALFLGISSGFPFSMIGATLTTRLAQDGVTKSAVTAFALTFLAYNFKFLWAPVVDHVRLPWIGRWGQRRSWLWLTGVVVAGAVAFLGVADPRQALHTVALAALLV